MNFTRTLYKKLLKEYFIGNTLVDMYVEYGSLVEAQVVFKKAFGLGIDLLEHVTKMECHIPSLTSLAYVVCPIRKDKCYYFS